ncbi:MAG: AbrB/MazE/SpoVT family DNA-binding domain-containing protein [Lachnospiraceae bacterium]|nr:AbrB/MazE/SpoVT family DNA-binding domain-containing protein [Lachnospiraceae bacterium]
MKATGIVRRIDELGRVVIPKEIRRTLKIREGDPLEIFTDREGEIILKKYSPIGEMRTFAIQYAESMALNTEHIVIITDRDQVIAAAGGKKDLLNKSLTKDFENILENRMLVKENTKGIRITDIDTERNSKIIQPIICEGDVIGAVVVMGKDEAAKLSETEVKVTAIAANFLGRQMEA